MKKSFIFSLALISAAFVSCSKELGVNGPAEEQGTRVEILVGNRVVADDDAKTAYTPGTGIAVQGTENMSMFYVPEGSSALAAAGILATPAGTPGTYSFTVPAGAERATWYAVMPYSSSLAGKNSSGTSLQLRLGPVQFPKANSFDPQVDYMVAEGFDLDVTSGAQTAEIKQFKRLFAPLRIRVTGLEEGEKIYAFTIESDQAPTKTSALNGLTYVSFGKEFSATKITSMETTSEGNAMSAVYKDGLAAVSGSWPVWLVVNPATLNSGSSLTFTVTTESKTYRRTVTLSSNLVLKVYSNAINDMSVNIKGDGSTSMNSFTSVFMDSKIPEGWTFANHGFFSEANSVLPAGVVRFTNVNGSFTFPTIPGKDIVGARIYTHPSNRSHASKTVTLTVDGTDKYNFNLATTAADGQGTPFTGGAVEVSLPTGKTSLAGLQVKVASAEQHIISAITLYLQDGSIDKNDYYSLYQAGEDIVIAGKVYNKATEAVPAKLVKAYEMTNANDITLDHTSNGIIFLDYDAADEKEDVFKFTHHYKPSNVVIIGRYKNHQPVLDLSTNGSYSLCPITGECVYMNVGIKSGNWAITSGNATAPVKVYLQDCTVTTTNDYIFQFSNKVYNFTNIVADNCIFSFARALVNFNDGYTSGADFSQFLECKITNSVIYKTGTVTSPMIVMKLSGVTYRETPNLVVTLNHDSLLNIDTNNTGVVGVNNLKQANIDYCVGESTLIGPKGTVLLMPTVVTAGLVGSTISYNWFNDTGSLGFSACFSGVTGAGATATNNTFTKGGASPFSTKDAGNLYFPVKTSVVTTGAGASYDTKLWKNWAE